MSEGHPVDAGTQAALDGLFTQISSEPARAFEQLRAINQAYRQSLAMALTPRLQAHLNAQSPETLQDYKNSVAEVDGLLKEFGLCWHDDGKPAVLTANMAYGGLSRYALMTLGRHGRPEAVGFSGSAPDVQIQAADYGMLAEVKSLRKKLLSGRDRE